MSAMVLSHVPVLDVFVCSLRWLLALSVIFEYEGGILVLPFTNNASSDVRKQKIPL